MQRNRLANFLPYLVVILAIVSLLGLNMGASSERISYYELQNVIEKEKVEEVSVSIGTNVTVVKGVYEKDKQKVTFTATIPSTSDEIGQVIKNLGNDSTKLTIVDADASNIFLETVASIIPFILFAVFAVWMLNRMNGANGANAKAFEFSKSRAKLEGKIRVRFNDVAGCDEEKQEMAEIIDYLKYPKKFEKMGARIPKGILLSGHPGTGKTLLAKAVAGEAGVPFFSISGSDFVEMFVGVGASRVRSLFEDAKKAAPAIIFIDEIDAVGRQRGVGLGGGNDEREQTLNQLLIVMDGFEGNEGIIIIAATNRSDVLDPALLRPGRFDRKVLVGRPDVKGREAILRVHAKNKPLAKNVDLKLVAQQTPGFVGADLENVLNEAALVAARRNKKVIDADDIDEAEDRVIAGPSKKDKTVSERDRQIVAYHEAGHTIVGLVLSNARVVHKVTIVPRGRAGGYMIALPKEDQMLLSKEDMKEQLAGLMGGRVAEEIIFNVQTTGASNDFEQATQMARAMVTEYGMSEKLGPVQYEGNHAMFGAQSPQKSISEQTAYEIDEEVRSLLNEARNKAAEIIQANRETHKLIAEALLKYETLDSTQIKSLYETGHMPEESEKDLEREAHALSYDEIKSKMEEN